MKACCPPGIDNNYSVAWDSGIAVPRGLCVGEVPSKLSGTIMFLAIAKAMCLSDTLPVDSSWRSHFTSDLGRWQILFEQDADTLSNFRAAVSSVWSVDISASEHVRSPDSDSMAMFQGLAVSLASSAQRSLGFRGSCEHGLIDSQER